MNDKKSTGLKAAVTTRPLYQRKIIIILLQCLFAAAALTISWMLRFHFTLSQCEVRNHAKYPIMLYYSLPIDVVVFVIVSVFFNLFQVLHRYEKKRHLHLFKHREDIDDRNAGFLFCIGPQWPLLRISAVGVSDEFRTFHFIK